MRRGARTKLDPRDLVDISKFPKAEGEYTFIHAILSKYTPADKHRVPRNLGAGFFI